MRVLRGMVYTDRMCFEPGEITVEGERIEKVEHVEAGVLSEKEAQTYILPGLVDIHFHGCAGYDFCDGTTEAVRAIASYEMTHGTTTICPATMTLSEEQLLGICAAGAEAAETEVLEEGIPLKDVLRGIYLEGPFISEDRKSVV